MYYAQALDSHVHIHLEGPHLKVRAGCWQRVARPNHMSFLGFLGGALWGAWAKARLVNLNQKEQGFGMLHGELIDRVHKRKVLEPQTCE